MIGIAVQWDAQQEGEGLAHGERQKMGAIECWRRMGWPQFGQGRVGGVARVEAGAGSESGGEAVLSVGGLGWRRCRKERNLGRTDAPKNPK